jgi:hypothetical protein
MRSVATLIALSVMGVATVSAASPSRPPTTDVTSVVVQNNRSTPVRVYLDLDNQEITLGRVDGMDTRTFTVPRWLVHGTADVNVFVNPQRGLELQTGQIELQEGKQLGVIVPEHAVGMPREISPGS